MTTDYNYLFKMVLVGDSAVGKTSLLLRYTDDTYTDGHIATIGVDFKIKSLHTDTNGLVRLQMWDTAGQDRFKSIVASFYRGADCLIVVYDVTDMESFEHVRQWFNEAEYYSNKNKLCAHLLVGNKTDLTSERVVPFDTAQALADELGLVYIETSAKNTTNVSQAFESMVHVLLEQRKSNPTLMDDPNGRLNAPIGLGRRTPKPCNSWDWGCSC